jgi:hypothetical protein
MPALSAENREDAPPKGRRLAPRLGVALLAALVVAAGSVWAVAKVSATPASLCAAANGPFKVFRLRGECVGISNGSFAFSRHLARVAHDIAQENNRAVNSSDYVTVALLTPMTSSGLISMQRIENEVDGAYAAQFAANSPRFEGSRPMIQLVLANEGSAEQAWHQVIGQLTAMAGAVHLVAVIGMGISVTPTFRGAWQLHRAHIPMVGSVLTADSLDWQQIPGLVDVMPDNQQQVAALAGYLRSRRIGNFFMAYDDAGSDLYTKNLKHDFNEAGLGAGLSSSMGFGTQNEMADLDQIARQICPAGSQAAPLVLYAGREGPMRNFLSSLRTAADCQHKVLTVVTGSDAADLPADITAPEPGEGQLTVIYSNLVNPGQVTRQAKTIFRASALGTPASLGGTWTIATYNAMAAVTHALINFEGSSGGGQPTPSAVWDFLRYLQGKYQVNGATGSFGIGSGTGRVISPVVPVMALANGHSPVPQPSPSPASR